MATCSLCGEEEVIRPNRHCINCKKLAKYIASLKHNEKKRLARNTPCKRCKTTLTQTKWCFKCSKIVRKEKIAQYKENKRRKDLARRIARENAELRPEDIEDYQDPTKISSYFLVRGTISNRTGE